MANEIGTTQLGDSIPTIVAAEALGYLKAHCVMARLVNRDYDNDVAQYGQTVDIVYTTSAASAQDKSAATVVTKQQLADSKYSVTLNKHKEITVSVEDPARVMSRPNWLERYLADNIMILAQQVDTDLAALYSGLSQSIDASAGLGEDDFREARRLINSAKAPLQNRFLVLHEDAESEALAIERVVNRDYAESLGKMAADSYVTRIYGFDTFMSQNIPVSTTVKNLAFHRDAMILASRPLPQAPAGMGVLQSVMDEDGLGLRVTVSYDHDFLSVLMTVDFLYGVAEMRDAFGVVITTAEV